MSPYETVDTDTTSQLAHTKVAVFLFWMNLSPSRRGEYVNSGLIHHSILILGLFI